MDWYPIYYSQGLCSFAITYASPSPSTNVCVSLSVTSNSLRPTLWTVVCHAPLSMAFSKQEYWSGLPFPSPGDLPNSGIEPRSPALQADSLPSEPLGKSNGQSEIHHLKIRLLLGQHHRML